ncbi:MAG: 50S ribosomal protein L11 methyltransferase [Gammaproteobacteria bacterium]|nr:MAG: 50S ribosomal protein L11 methyltransferase [Gammaproteobacteria bacterium]
MTAPAKWLQIIACVNADNSEAVSEHLESIGALAVTLQDDADEALYETIPHSESQWQSTRVVGLFDGNQDAKALTTLFSQQCGELIHSFKVEHLEDEIWERRCLEHVKPMRFGHSVWIYPSWSDEKPPENARVISLDPGLAFGTGTHPTTALCLEWIDDCNFDNKTVIDYGCGSGILAVAAIKCGANHVDAVDHDDQAVMATADNAEKNHCRSQIDTFLPDQFSSKPVDIVFANILAGPLINLAQTLADLCKQGGKLILSGLLLEHYDAIHNAYSPWFDLASPREKEGWLLIECTRGC